MRANEESRNDVNNLKNNIVRVPRQLARQNTARGCEPSSCKLSPQLSSLFPILSVTDGDTTRTFTYHADGQIASANYGGSSETFLWDGLALIQRDDEQFVNEPHVGGGNPVASSKGTSYFNDALGTTVGSKSNGKYSAAVLTAFGEDLTVHAPTPTQNSNFFTGKPFVEGLGHAFLMRNYRAGLAKWQTADPMGYPDGWNQLAYCGNGVVDSVDLWGCVDINLHNQVQEYEIWKMAQEFQNPGIITVAGHGNSNGIGGSLGITVKNLANLIRSNSAWDGNKSVELISCQVGLGAYPQQLANELRVSVYAPDAFVFWFGAREDGGKYPLPYIYDQEYDENGNATGFPDWTKKGKWIRFDPE